MIVVTKGVQKDIYVTLNESITLSNPYFLLVFTNISTKDILTFVVNSADDKSSYPERVNQFELNIDSFDDVKTGQWRYDIYEQLSSTNHNPTGLNLLETGKMLLKDSNEVTDYVAGYAPQTQFN
jgi:hypothetical protein